MINAVESFFLRRESDEISYLFALGNFENGGEVSCLKIRQGSSWASFMEIQVLSALFQNTF